MHEICWPPCFHNVCICLDFAVMEGPEALGAPPPYAPPENARPPPYAPDNATTTENTQAGSTQHTSYGTGNPCKHDTPIQQQPAPPYCAVDPNPQLNTSTTLLVSHEKKPPTFFVLSLITCLCFSPLFGLLAMVFAGKVYNILYYHIQTIRESWNATEDITQLTTQRTFFLRKCRQFMP